MGNGKYVAYYRVSTGKQQKSGLGLEAQQEAVRLYLNGGDWKLVGAFTEAESGKRNDRPALAQALALCRIHNATLVVAKLDRLARNARFLLTVRDETGESGVVFCDLPTIPEGQMGKYMVTNMAAVAELEAGLISQRTRAALQAAKARGQKLGCKNDNIAAYAKRGAAVSASARAAKASKRAIDILPLIKTINTDGKLSLRQIAAVLNERKIPTARGGEWSAVQVSRLLRRE
jgi:DNA invertase Pin-like site-specific DNA recombinase